MEKQCSSFQSMSDEALYSGDMLNQHCTIGKFTSFLFIYFHKKVLYLITCDILISENYFFTWHCTCIFNFLQYTIN